MRARWLVSCARLHEGQTIEHWPRFWGSGVANRLLNVPADRDEHPTRVLGMRLYDSGGAHAGAP
jgi:hypothetical protein